MFCVFFLYFRLCFQLCFLVCFCFRRCFLCFQLCFSVYLLFPSFSLFFFKCFLVCFQVFSCVSFISNCILLFSDKFICLHLCCMWFPGMLTVSLDTFPVVLTVFLGFWVCCLFLVGCVLCLQRALLFLVVAGSVNPKTPFTDTEYHQHSYQLFFVH